MIRINVLPDDALLDIFDFCGMIMNPSYHRKRVEAWQSLVHVCRRWRNLVFKSPRRLNLNLFCTPKTPAKDRLDIWPALPLIIQGMPTFSSSTDNMIAALGQSNRVRQVILDLAGWQLEEILAPMQAPFPELTDLKLWSYDEPISVISDSFLGGSAPRLRCLKLESISFLGLPKLLLSATHLVELHLYDIPHSGYISPKAMVTLLLSVLSSLEKLSLGFRSPQSRPERESPSLSQPKRSIFPALTRFRYRGVTEYLEDFVTRIDTPQLDHLEIRLFNQIDFDCPGLAQFISCTPKLRALDEALLVFNDSTASVTLRSQTYRSSDLLINISCREPDWQLSSIEQICNSSLLPLFSAVKDLFLERQYSRLVWKNDAIESTLWSALLLPFTAVRSLYLSKELAPCITDLVGGRITEALPSLQNVFVEDLKLSGSSLENIGQSVVAHAQQLSDYIIPIPGWEM